MKKRIMTGLHMLLIPIYICYGNQIKIFYGDSFVVEYPKEIIIEVETPADFTVYRFKYNDQILLGAYVGHHPSFYSDVAEGAYIKEGYINNLPYVEAITKGTNTESKDVLILLKKDDKLPLFIHFMCEELRPEYMELVNKVIFSVRYCE